MSVRIRPATTADLEEVRRLVAAASLPPAGLEEHFSEGFAVAETGSRIVGAAGIETWGPFGLLRSAVVDPEWRGQGVGVALAEDRIAWARGAGLQALYLLTTTAEGWFPRLGFRRIDRDALPLELQGSEELRGACPASAVAMELPLR